ncbi:HYPOTHETICAL PROTEIN MCJ_007100 [Mesomycoplasma conjunctivae]|uniref:Uncharacterized protein n=1 Tax=Mesomycoplasma conjunctivae (strain ATCC 25834 / NCTC 10147 / HRC/581) TaxID=572263 RepID=C5J7D2_MESCH|nr:HYPOTHETICAL PROTEIN MCJ_007100 [Mesomycoplasma conjunctivae]
MKIKHKFVSKIYYFSCFLLPTSPQIGAFLPQTRKI